MAVGPLITLAEHTRLCNALRTGLPMIDVTLDLGRSQVAVAPHPDGWRWQDQTYPYLESCRDRTVYYWSGAAFEPVARFTQSLIKLVPTAWGPPTFEIDGIKMLPTSKLSPWIDAQQKVALIAPRGKRILDTCGGLGYFAACAIAAGAKQVDSYEKNADVLWLRGLNPWSPAAAPPLALTHGDVSVNIQTLTNDSFDAALHDPPRFGIAGELYSQDFYDQLARVLKRGAPLFHYTGAPNSRSRARDLPGEVATRLQRAGFETRRSGDGLLAVNRRRRG
jgi:predicted methyltransferase